MPQSQNVSIAESVHRSLCQALDGLAAQASHKGGCTLDCEPIRRMLEAFPLASDDFGRAINRLTNASDYLRSGERGAAQYELRLLRRSLEK